MLKKARQNKKGFSLVELIIVMAIMVALIAVLAPQFVKYVQRARDSSVSDAAENVYEIAKSEYALGNITGQGTITVSATNGDGVIAIKCDTLTVGSAADSGYSFKEACGIDTAKTVKSDVVYTITVGGTPSAPTFKMAKGGDKVTAEVDLTK